jgi:hypothetical protein
MCTCVIKSFMLENVCTYVMCMYVFTRAQKKAPYHHVCDDSCVHACLILTYAKNKLRNCEGRERGKESHAHTHMHACMIQYMPTKRRAWMHIQLICAQTYKHTDTHVYTQNTIPVQTENDDIHVPVYANTKHKTEEREERQSGTKRNIPGCTGIRPRPPLRYIAPPADTVSTQLQ